VHRAYFRPARAISAEETDQVLFVRRALAGDRVAIGNLVRQFAPIIHAAAARLLLKHSRGGSAQARREAEDVTQEVLLRLFGSRAGPLGSWDFERGSLASYLRMLTQRQTIDVLRSGRRNPFAAQVIEAARLDRLQHPGTLPERLAMLRQELGAILARAQSSLSPKGFEMFRHLCLDATSVQDICEATGQKPASVYQWRRRIQLLLRSVASDQVEG